MKRIEALNNIAGLLVVLDIIIVIFAYSVSLWMRFDFHVSQIDPVFIKILPEILTALIICTLLFLRANRLYRRVWTSASAGELYALLIAFGFMLLVVVLMRTVVVEIWPQLVMPWSFYIGGLLISFLLCSAIRFFPRFLRGVYRRRLEREVADSERENVMLIGAGQAGAALIREMVNSTYINNSRICCVIDDDKRKQGSRFHGIPVVGTRADIPEKVKVYDIDRIIYAIPSLEGTERKEILNICKDTGCKLQTIPGLYQLINEDISIKSLQDVQLEDLLGRDENYALRENLKAFIYGRKILVTGGGGSIGSELCRQIAEAGPKLLIILDIYENTAYELYYELTGQHPDLDIKVRIGSVRDVKRLDNIMNEFHPDFVFHAAAHKHVPLMEYSSGEAVKNNVFGTWNTAQAAVRAGVQKFVLISTDKAVNPTNVMGATKRICEMVIQMMERSQDRTEFVAVRFGNVLGSNGSVVPLFEKQIRQGGPVTVTHPEVTRFFMTIPEATSLVLEASRSANGGEIFVLDMGEPVKIDDMARNLIKLSGLTPDVDIPIIYTGLREGEKLYEEMLMDEEGLQDTAHKQIFIAQPIDMDDECFRQQLSELEKQCDADIATVKKAISAIVPTYQIRENPVKTNN